MVARGHAVGIAVGLALATGVARGDGLDAERFVPAVGVEPGFGFEHPAVPLHLGFGLGLFADLADDPVVVRDTGTGAIVSRPLDTAVTADLLATIGLFGWAELGVHLPLQLVYEGDDGSQASAGVGDLRLVPKVALLRTGTAERHFVLGASVPISLPTGDDEALRGAGGVTVGPHLAGALHSGPLGLGLGVGYRWRSQHPVGLPWGDELAVSLMAAYGVVPERLTFQAEAALAMQVGADVDGADLPLEVLGGLIFQASPSWGLHAGAGVGLTDGIGSPDLRVVGGVRFRHRGGARHGLGDSDGDGIRDADDDCPTEAEDADGFEDDDGCPEPDNDLDGVPDETDECPEQPAERGGDTDGCPSKTFVTVIDGEIQIFGKIQFKTGSAELHSKSGPLLDQIAVAMRANPDVARVRIEGHTDDVGDEALNLRLSQDRATSVERALIERGVDAGRLETKGLGETRPAAPNASAAGRAKNRRVEFIIVGAGP